MESHITTGKTLMEHCDKALIKLGNNEGIDDQFSKDDTQKTLLSVVSKAVEENVQSVRASRETIISAIKAIRERSEELKVSSKKKPPSPIAANVEPGLPNTSKPFAMWSIQEIASALKKDGVKDDIIQSCMEKGLTGSWITKLWDKPP
ncbi:MAG: hypothetical protein SGARI_004811 [Bacillariaceae sp.]